MSTVFNDEDIEFGYINLTNLDIITVNRNLTLDNALSNKNYVDDELNKNTILRFNQSLQNYLKVTVGNTEYILTKSNTIKITDTKVPKTGIAGGLLPLWRIVGNDKNSSGKTLNFFKRN